MNNQIKTFYPSLERLNNFAEYVNTLEKANAHLDGAAKILFSCDWSPPPPENSIAECVINRPIRQTISRTQKGCYEIIAEHLPRYLIFIKR